MCDPITIGVAVTAASTVYSGYSQYQAGAAESKQYQYQAEAARQQGAAELKRGEQQSNLIQDSAKDAGARQAQQLAQLSSGQRAALAANGVTGVTAQDVALSTARQGNIDEIALRHDADLQSWSATTDAQYKNWQDQQLADQYGIAAKNAKKTGARNAFSTLLGGAAQIAGGGAFGAGGGAKNYGSGVGLKPS